MGSLKSKVDKLDVDKLTTFPFDLSKLKLKPKLKLLIDPSFLGINRLFLLPFEDNAHRTTHTRYFLLKVKIKDYNVMNDGQNFFNQSIKNGQRTYDSIREIAAGQEED